MDRNLIARMQQHSALSTWTWVFKYWMVLYLILVSSGVILALNSISSVYWILFLVIVPIVIIPTTYRNLVGGGCSLRFQICALVKGISAGIVFLLLTGLADTIIWSVMSGSLSWTPLSEPRLLANMYLLLLISGMIGGFGARIMEVRGATRTDIGSLTPIFGEDI